MREYEIRYPGDNIAHPCPQPSTTPLPPLQPSSAPPPVPSSQRSPSPQEISFVLEDISSGELGEIEDED